MNTNQKSEHFAFIWRATSMHVIAYFIAGIFAVLFMNYREQFASETMATIMRPVDSPWVSLGPGLQLFRGIIIALVLLPFKGIITSKNGWIKLLFLILGLSYISTIGPTFGSFDGYIYTKVPYRYHLLGIPETLLYVFLFSFFLFLWHRRPSKIWNIITGILVVLIIVMSLLGYLSTIGLITQ